MRNVIYKQLTLPYLGFGGIDWYDVWAVDTGFRSAIAHEILSEVIAWGPKWDFLKPARARAETRKAEWKVDPVVDLLTQIHVSLITHVINELMQALVDLIFRRPT